MRSDLVHSLTFQRYCSVQLEDQHTTNDTQKMAFSVSQPLFNLKQRQGTTQCSRRPISMVSSTEKSDNAPTIPTRPGLRPGEIEVIFTNNPTGEDISAAANPGDILLQVGDSVGITIPRACVSGLCGSCTCDVVTSEGAETVRACQTSVTDMEGKGEMVIDLARMKETRGRKVKNPMARFDNLDTEYKAGAQPKRSMRGRLRETECAECNSTGDVECYGCDGSGSFVDPMGAIVEGQLCMLCSGSGSLRCADCQGEGVIKVR